MRRPWCSRNASNPFLLDCTFRIGPTISPSAAQSLIRDLRPLLAETDLHTLALTFDNIAVITVKCAEAQPMLEKEILPSTIELVAADSLHGVALDSLNDFLSAYVKVSPNSAREIVSRIIEVAITAPAVNGQSLAMVTAARCIGTVTVSSDPTQSKSIIGEFVRQVSSGKSSQHIYLSLLALGEIGRTTDLAEYDVFQRVLAYFDSKKEQEKTAAAFAAGNIAVGNHKLFLPTLLDGIKDSNTGTSLLYLHAIRETVTHSTMDQIEAIADALWEPLLIDTPDSLQDDGTRNVKAAVLGKLSLTKPNKFIPELHSRLTTGTASTRAIIAAAIRYALIDPSPKADQVLAPIILDFLQLVKDPDYVSSLFFFSVLSADHYYLCNIVLLTVFVSASSPPERPPTRRVLSERRRRS